jgi:hypothetical protein
MVLNRYKLRVTDMATISDTKNMEIGMPLNVSLEKQNGELFFSNCFSNTKADTADDWLRSFSFAWNQLI